MTRLQTAAGDTEAYLASARPSPGRPVLLLHAWWGLTEVIRDLADRLAGDGFTVLAPDLFDGTVLRTIEEAKAHQQEAEADEVSENRLHGRVGAAFDHLLALPDLTGERAAVIAFSFGAWYGARLADRRPEAAVVVIYYGGIGGSELPGDPDKGIRPAYLGHFAAEDPYQDDAGSMMQLAQERTGSEAYMYDGTHHWFAEPDRPEFDAEASELAYGRTVEFLRANLS
jgi:carboxymethylenebutenolidase